jgi:hypothetical protein
VTRLGLSGLATVLALVAGACPPTADAALTVDATVEERMAYQEQVASQLEQLGHELERLRGHLDDAPSEHIKVEWEASLRELEAQRHVALAELSRLRASTGERWLQTRDQLERVLVALEAALVRTADRIHEQAPASAHRPNLIPNLKGRG